MEYWTKTSLPDLAGKTFIVTGANSGIGYESALALAENGALVVLACRDAGRAQQARNLILQSAPNASLESITLDLGDLNSISSFASEFKKNHQRLDGLLNNGGLIAAKRSETSDGFEAQFGINHLGHFALTGRLLDVLVNTPDSRVVTMGSRMHTSGKINWDDLMSQHKYDRWAAYKQSKLANLLFAFELSRRFDKAGSSAISLAAHPGVCKTGWADRNMEGIMKFIGRMMGQPASIGALSPLYALTDPNVQSGGYYGPDQDKKAYPVETKAAKSAYDEEAAKRLWEISERLTGISYEIS